jgi:ankyrin repeat protein
LAVGANVNIRDDDGKTALIHATESGNEYWHNGKNTLENTVKTLLAAGADVTIRDKTDKTELMYAVEKERDNWIVGLLE